ncbi:MAG: TIGR04255 family protein [Gemmatimonadaceae bacterium]
MAIPDTPRVVFKTNVLESVLCQLRFPPILSISTAPPAGFQDRVRQSYPLYDKDEGLEIPSEARALLGTVQLPGLPVVTRHAFRSADGNRALYLTQDFLAIEEKRYVRWEEFRPEINRGIEALVSEYAPAFFSRIGLRYRDLIDRAQIRGVEEKPWPDLIRSQLLGPLAADETRDDVVDYQSLTVVRIPTIRGARVRFQHGLRTSGDPPQPRYFFDVDCSTEERTQTSKVLELLSEFHRFAGNLFRWSIQPALQTALEPSTLS